MSSLSAHFSLLPGLAHLWALFCVSVSGIAADGESVVAVAQRSPNVGYVIENLDLPGAIKMEASGLAVIPDGRLAVATRNGEIWFIPIDNKGAGKPKRYAFGLHEPLGLTWHDGALYTTQRSEVTQLRDTDGDDLADEYLTFIKGWGVSGSYHEYAYGPVFDPSGTAWITLNSSMGAPWAAEHPKGEPIPWRGWCLNVPPGGKLTPIACGFRSPCGIGTNLAGDVFVTDQQGNWVPTSPVFHVKKGGFYAHADSLVDTSRPESPVKHPGKIQEGITVAEAIQAVPGYVPPVVWLPYVKMGQSTTGLLADSTQGKFGPFAGQMFVGEFAMSAISRVFMEKVGGEYQGACFPFLQGFECAVLQMAFLPDNTLVAGETNRGWNSIGSRSFGLQRVRWTGETPFEILKMEALPGGQGFRFTFTQPVDPASASSLGSYTASSYTYLFHSKYGSPEIDPQPVTIKSAEVDPADHKVVTVKCTGLRAGYVHEFDLAGVKQGGASKPLAHSQAYYTLNRMP